MQRGSYRRKTHLVLILSVLIALVLVLTFYTSHTGDMPTFGDSLPDNTEQSDSTPRQTTAESGAVRRQLPDKEKAIAAFPGAQGDGAASKGGRGGRVLIVERLDDPCPSKACTTAELADVALTTPGTLRWALLQDYPRTIVFRVSGIIRLQEDRVEQVDKQLHVRRSALIRVSHPYLTVAGQTAPAGGITIAGNGISIETHDVVLRYLRFRTGRGKQAFFEDQQNPETLMIGNGAERVMIDHCSFSWMPAEGVSVYTGSSDQGDGTAKDITLSWNMIGEGLVQHKDGRGHPNSAFMSGFDGDPRYAARNITLHHNLLLHTQKRNGDLLSYNGRLVNNLFYNWQWLPTVLAGGVEADLIGNLWKPGPLSELMDKQPQGIHLVPAAATVGGKEPDDWWHAVPGTPSLWLSGNAFASPEQVPPNQQDLICYYRHHEEDCQPVQPEWFRERAMPPGSYPVVAEAIDQAVPAVLKQAGASQRINLTGQWVANRDPVDVRFVTEYQNGNYALEHFPWHEDQVGGYPQQIDGVAYPDTDRDGMSDLWEVKQGLDPADATDAIQPAKQGGGYTNLEVFINGAGG
ncbi:MAG: hypothetical protein CSA79_04410 [Thiothrix nivea]|nr:MAG: hypothetical protein CSA79_04410 [Thiothrix nivea]